MPLQQIQLHRQRKQLACASREAEGYLELGMYPQALNALQRRGKLVHANAHACYLLGETLREMSRYREAVIPLVRSVSLQPTDVDSWLALGWCYKRTGEIHRAIEALEAGVANSPDSSVLRYNLACYYSLAGRRLDSLRQLKKAFDVDPSLALLVEEEEDFGPMRNDIGFRMLMQAFIA